mgnify:CR=1 FL=1|tara:strand:- start:157 stop:681 length:525 start_codon:yes stop_codon:yes gene_type:complete
MALWGNNDAVGSEGTVSLNYTSRVVTGSGTTFGETGAAQVGDVIRFGSRSGTYFGDAVIVSIASTISCTVDSTMGLSGAAIASTDYQVSELPKYTVLDAKYSEATYGTDDSYVYGVAEGGTAAANGSSFEVAHAGWVGVTTYVDNHGNLRVKSEVLVAASGITTGNVPAYPPAS